LGCGRPIGSGLQSKSWQLKGGSKQSHTLPFASCGARGASASPLGACMREGSMCLRCRLAVRRKGCCSCCMLLWPGSQWPSEGIWPIGSIKPHQCQQGKCLVACQEPLGSWPSEPSRQPMVEGCWPASLSMQPSPHAGPWISFQTGGASLTVQQHQCCLVQWHQRGRRRLPQHFPV
jgi:hypothetical protein